VLDVINRGGQYALVDRNDMVGHLLRGQAGVVPDHTYDRDIDFREDVRWRLENNYWADDQNQKRHYDEGVRAPKGKFNNPHQQLPGVLDNDFCQEAEIPTRTV